MTDRALSDLRAFAESCAQAFDIPMPAIVRFVADLGGAEQYAEGVVGPVEFRDKLQAFCRDYRFQRLPPDQQARELEQAKRYNTFSRRQLLDRVEPILRSHHILRVDFEDIICRALHIPSIQFLHKYRGSLDKAIDDICRFLDERYPQMAPKRSQAAIDREEQRRADLLAYVKPRFEALKCYGNPFEMERAYREAWKMNFLDAARCDIAVPELCQMFETWYQGKLASKDLHEHLGRTNGETLNDPEQAKPGPEQPGLLDDLIGSAAKLEALPGVTTAASGPAESSVPIDTAKDGQTAPPASETSSAGDAVPEIAGTPLQPSAAQDAGQPASPQPEPQPPAEKEVAQLYVKLDFVLDDTLQYTLEARWSLETGDVWIAKAICRGNRPDERTRPLLIKDIETYLRAKKPVEVVLDIEYEPTVEEINDLRKPAMAMIRDIFDHDNDAQVADHFEKGTGYKRADLALRFQPKQPILDRLHAYLMMQVAEARAAEDAAPNPTQDSANKLFPGMVGDVTEETPRALAVVDKPQAMQQVPAGANNLGFRMPTPEQWAFMVSFADFAIRSGFYPGVKDKNQAIAVMVQGFTLGVDPVSSLRGIDPIPSKRGIQLCFRAKLAKALVMRTGYCEKFVVVGDATKATATVKRKDHPENVFTFTYKDAETAKLIERNPDVWKNYTAKMLKNRVITEAVGVEFSEVYFAFSAAVDDDDEEDAA